MIIPVTIPEGWRHIESNPFFKDERVTRLLLTNGREVDLVPGSFMEIQENRTATDVYIATDRDSGEGIMGPVRDIVAYWFLPQDVDLIKE